jgi:hypothetical protein
METSGSDPTRELDIPDEQALIARTEERKRE